MAVAKRPLSRDRIIAAALELLDDKGMDGLTMRALGKRLGVDPMAVYHHVPNKDALLDGIVEAVWSELRLPDRRRRWQDEARDLAVALRTLLQSHPHALPILATRQNLSAPGFDAADRAIGLLRRSGLTPSASLDMLSAWFSFLIGHALAEVGPPPADAHDVSQQALAEALEALGGHRYPNLVEALASKENLDDMDEAWHAGVEALIAGVEAAVRRRR